MSYEAFHATLKTAWLARTSVIYIHYTDYIHRLSYLKSRFILKKEYTESTVYVHIGV